MLRFVCRAKATKMPHQKAQAAKKEMSAAKKQLIGEQQGLDMKGKGKGKAAKKK